MANKRFEQTYKEVMENKKANFALYVEPKKLIVLIIEFGEHWDNEEEYKVFSGLENDFIKKTELKKCKKNESTHMIVVCEEHLANGAIIGMKKKLWVRYEN